MQDPSALVEGPGVYQESPSSGDGDKPLADHPAPELTGKQLELAMEMAGSVAAIVITAEALVMSIEDEDVRRAVYLLFGQGAVERLEAAAAENRKGVI